VDWRFVDAALSRHADARFKFVASHYPVFPVNGFRPPCWRVSAEDAGPLWQTLVKHKVSAYLCAHVIAFDVQLHDGIPQICSAGAGYSLLYPPQTEYHHAVQLAVDSRRLAWHAVDTTGNVRERGAWPLDVPSSDTWPVIDARGQAVAELRDSGADVLLMHIEGQGAAISPEEQTLVTGWTDSSAPPAFWIGLDGGRLQVRISAQRGEPTVYWRGPVVSGPSPSTSPFTAAWDRAASSSETPSRVLGPHSPTTHPGLYRHLLAQTLVGGDGACRVRSRGRRRRAIRGAFRTVPGFIASGSRAPHDFEACTTRRGPDSLINAQCLRVA